MSKKSSLPRFLPPLQMYSGESHVRHGKKPMIRKLPIISFCLNRRETLPDLHCNHVKVLRFEDKLCTFFCNHTFLFFSNLRKGKENSKTYTPFSFILISLSFGTHTTHSVLNHDGGLLCGEQK